jgi:hypothetical protein
MKDVVIIEIEGENDEAVRRVRFKVERAFFDLKVKISEQGTTGVKMTLRIEKPKAPG